MCTIGLKQEAHLRCMRVRTRVNSQEFIRFQVRANETYSQTMRQWSDRNNDVLMNVQSTLKSAVFGSRQPRVRHCLRLLVGVVASCANRLVRLICCRIILIASCSGSLLIYHPLAPLRIVLSPLPSGRVRSGVAF